MNDAIMTLHDFGAAYEKKTVLTGVNTSIRRGRITAIIGPSGCGKSTMLKAMDRMLELERDVTIKGSIHLDGQDIHTIPADELRRRVVLPQALPQLVSGVLLGGCYAMGAAAPLIFTGAVIISKVPKDVMKPAMALPYHLYMLLTQGTSSENAYGTAFVMMVIVLVTNTLATWFAWRKKK